MLWITRDYINKDRIGTILAILFNKRPQYVPQIIALVDPAIDTEWLLEKVRQKEIRNAITYAKWFTKSALLPERKAPWSPVRTQNPLWPHTGRDVPPMDSLEVLHEILFTIMVYEHHHGPIVSLSMFGRPREYDYRRIIAVLISSMWSGKCIKDAFQDAVSKGFYVSLKDPGKVPPPSLISYVREKLNSENPEALHELVAITDRMAISIGIDIFDLPITLKSIDWSGLETQKYHIYPDLQGNLKLRRVAEQITYVNRLVTNTIPQVIVGEPHDITDMLNEQEGLCIGDDGYNAVRPVIEGIKKGFLFLTPSAIEALRDPNVKKLAKRLYKFRKMVERPFGNFAVTRVRIRSRREDFMLQEAIMWAIAKNIRSYMGLKALRRMIYCYHEQEKKELVYEGIQYVIDGLQEALLVQ